MGLYSGTTKPKPGRQLDWGHPLTRGLIARYLFNEGNGTGLRNLVGKHHAMLTNMDPATDWVGSYRGGALDFDGTDDYAISNDGFSINALGSASVVVWFRAVGQSAKYLVGCPNTTTQMGLSVGFQNTTQVRATYRTTGANAALNATVTYDDGRWHQTVATWDGASFRVFFDGAFKTSTALVGTLLAAANELNIGRDGAGASFDHYAAAQIDDVRIYRRCLLPEEVAWLYSDPYADMRGSRVWWRKERDRASLEIEAELAGAGNGWTNLTPLRYPVGIRYGISGGGPIDLVAGVGSLDFSLSNGRSGGNPLGYYSPEHVACRAGFGIGTHVRARWAKPGGMTRNKFYGWLEAIDPTAGQHRGMISQCVALDWMHAASEHSANVATQVNKRIDEVVAVLSAAVPRQPEGFDLDVGDTTFPYALGGGESAVLTEFQRLAQSEYGRIYQTGDGVVHVEKRTARLSPNVVAMFDDVGAGGMAGLVAPHDRGKLVNRVKGTIHPRRVDVAATTVLFSLQQASPVSQHSVAAGASVVIEGSYNDPNARAVSVGGTDMVAPVATTHYTMFANANGTGTNLTASFTVVVGENLDGVYGADSAYYTITNTSGTLGWITKLEAVGRGLYDYDPSDVWVTDQASIDAYGEAVLEMDMPYLSDVPTVNSIGGYIRDAWSTPGAIEAVLSVHGSNDDDIDAIMAREPGDVITVSETAIGVAYAYFINYVDIRIAGRYDVSAEYVLQRAPIGLGSFFTLDSATLGQLDEDVLAPL